MHYLERTLWTAAHLQPHPLDPPLRYVPFAVLYRLGFPATWETLNTAAVWTIWVVTPVLVFVAVRELLGDAAAIVALAATVLLRLSPEIVTSPYWNGPLHNELVVPICLVAVVSTYRVVTEPDSRRWSAVTGVVLGVGSLTQITNTVLVAGAIGLALLASSHYRDLGVIGAIATALASGNLWYGRVWENTRSHVTIEGRNVFEVVLTPGGLIVVLTAACVALAVVVLLREVRDELTPGETIGVAGLVAVLIWEVVWQTLGLDYYLWATRPLRALLVLVGVLAIGKMMAAALRTVELDEFRQWLAER